MPWWYFLDHPEIPPDNNLAERTLRLAVTKRKVSGGSRAMVRFQHTANLLTVIQTCRHQGRSVIEFFQQAIKAIYSARFSALLLKSRLRLQAKFFYPGKSPEISRF